MKILDPTCGSNIQTAIKTAIAEPDGARFLFNGIVVEVAHDSDPALIYRDWDRAIQGYISNKVGTHPAAELTDDEIASDARIEAENKSRRHENHDKWKRKIECKTSHCEWLLAGASALIVNDQGAWDRWKKKNNHDDYSSTTVAYTERWGRLMQIQIKQGTQLDRVAETFSQTANVDGITGYMFDYAISALKEHWVHGAELRRWYDKAISPT